MLPIGIVAALADELATVAGADPLLSRRKQVETIGLHPV